MKPSKELGQQVYFNEFNVLQLTACYLPLSSGLLKAFAQTSQKIRDHYRFMPFLFHRDSPERILAAYDRPSVAAFSVSMWNEQLNLAVAREVKRRHPDCLIVFGGPQVPHVPVAYFAQHPFLDVAVRSEGEEAFSEILERFLEGGRDFAGIPSVSWRDPATGECRSNGDRPQQKDLDVFPSPYLEGLFDDLITGNADLEFQAIIETNRGCPFLCTFCYWGQGGLSRKYRFHGLDRVARELEWCSLHKIRYVFNADSNFGMHPRDGEIARTLVELKRRYGYPDKFRTCFGKNTDDKIFEIGSLLHRHGLEKGITLARQSNDLEVLKNIRRANIKLSTYRSLQTRFNEANVPLYAEFILGLPGETYATWTAGIEEMLESGLKNQLFSYFCDVYPNTELADPQYQKRFGIVTQRVVLNEIHGALRREDLPTEYVDIVVKTDAMSVAEWRLMTMFSWMTSLLHSMKLGFFALMYLNDRLGIRYADVIDYIVRRRMPAGTAGMFRDELSHFEENLDGILQGRSFCRAMPEFGAIYWSEEEAAFLRVSADLDRFYEEFHGLLKAFLQERGVAFSEEELAEVMEYQRLRIPSLSQPGPDVRRFGYNLPEYFQSRYTANPIGLQGVPQTLLRRPRTYDGDRVTYARENVLWGRKSGTILVPASWEGGPVLASPKPVPAR